MMKALQRASAPHSTVEAEVLLIQDAGKKQELHKMRRIKSRSNRIEERCVQER